MPVTITSPDRLDERQQAAVIALANAIEAADGAPPLSDHGRSQLGSDRVRHFVATPGGAEIIGYAQVEGTAAELIGAPAALEPLLDAARADTPELRLWAHGTASRLSALLDARGYERARVLWQLRWDVGPLPAVATPADVRLRSFVVGQDEPAWLAVNAAAFAHHPEQGAWTRADITAREAEPWFDPSGFLLADRGGELLGFHWTKRHSTTLGEVYVLGVAPAAQGLKLGAALLVAGLADLAARGITEVLLYVDDDNPVALALYERYGFTRHDHDVQYRLAP